MNVETAVYILFRKYAHILAMKGLNQDQKAGYLAAVCNVDLEIPGVLTCKPLEDLTATIHRALLNREKNPRV